MKVSRKNLVRGIVLLVLILLTAILSPVYLKNGGFYFDDQGLKIENFRFRSANTQLLRFVNDSTRKGDVVLWYRHKRENRCVWVFQMYQQTHLDLKTQCEDLLDKDFVINYEWAASNPRLASSAKRIGLVKDFF